MKTLRIYVDPPSSAADLEAWNFELTVEWLIYHDYAWSCEP